MAPSGSVDRNAGILIVDDHPLLTEGLQRVIGEEKGLAVCAVATSAEQALKQLEQFTPDLVITDLTLPGKGGLDLIKDLRTHHPSLPVIVLSMHDEMLYAERAFKAGAKGYLMKESAAENLITAIRTVLGGGVHASPAVTGHFLRGLSRGGSARPALPMKRLTDREMEVFELIGAGVATQEIGSRLGISPRTVDAHRARIRRKLDLSGASELLRYAIRWMDGGSTRSA